MTYFLIILSWFGEEGTLRRTRGRKTTTLLYITSIFWNPQEWVQRST